MTKSQPPPALPVRPGAIPPVLTARDQFVLWRWTQVDRGGGLVWTKPPRDTSGRICSITDPANWMSFHTAFSMYVGSGDFYHGIGRVVTPDEGIIGVDFDHCIERGAIDSWVRCALWALNSYTERSPSGTGVRVFCRATMPDDKGRVGERVEVYPAGRYLTVTGHRLSGAPEDVRDAQAAVDLILANFVTTRSQDTGSTPNASPRTAQPHSGGIGSPRLSDADVIALARKARNGRKFEELFDLGSLDAYDDDHSRADQALVSLLSFWTQDEGQLDRLMRASALRRGKWEDRPDYRGRTTERALSGSREQYTPRHLVEDAARRQATSVIRSLTI